MLTTIQTKPYTQLQQSHPSLLNPFSTTSAMTVDKMQNINNYTPQDHSAIPLDYAHIYYNSFHLSHTNNK